MFWHIICICVFITFDPSLYQNFLLKFLWLYLCLCICKNMYHFDELNLWDIIVGHSCRDIFNLQETQWWSPVKYFWSDIRLDFPKSNQVFTGSVVLVSQRILWFLEKNLLHPTKNECCLMNDWCSELLSSLFVLNGLIPLHCTHKNGLVFKLPYSCDKRPSLTIECRWAGRSCLSINYYNTFVVISLLLKLSSAIVTLRQR